ncbi:MAG: hypothetical protein HY012_00825 [Acidobacteria bacterium]|nr:hypothetical protein [Acidobacteriota bacterium]
MEPERIELSTRERDRLKVLHEVEQGQSSTRGASLTLRFAADRIQRKQKEEHPK